jgi:hypothetical protein
LAKGLYIRKNTISHRKSREKFGTHEKVIFLSFHSTPPLNGMSFTTLAMVGMYAKFKIFSPIEKYEKTFSFVKK